MFRVMKRAFVAVCLLLAALPAAARLPKSVVPAHYALTITPDLANETFTGEETIDVDVKEPVDSITLNAVEVQLTDVVVTAGGKQLTPAVDVDPAAQTVTLKLGATIPAGKAMIRDRFSAKLNQKLR